MYVVQGVSITLNCHTSERSSCPGFYVYQDTLTRHGEKKRSYFWVVLNSVTRLKSKTNKITFVFTEKGLFLVL